MNSNECREDGNRHAFRDHLHQKRLLRAIAHYVAPALFLAFAFGLADVAPTHAQKAPKVSEKNLPKTYREWLDRDVVYIITKEERDTFLRLGTDDARDKFIQHFWDIRNPNPGSPDNSYKDEIYQRIAYADAHFGAGSGGEGWRTARGQTYITLGPPQQKETHYGSANLRPIEIWFYSNTNFSTLPPFFYVMFYQRDSIGDFRYYSPFFNGPTDLVTGVEAINDNTAALRIIQASVGPEVARIAQTLLPDEPVDPYGRISFQSDIMISQLKSLANQPATKADLERRRRASENVTARLVVEGHDLNITMLPVRDSHGLTRLDYAIRLHRPGDLTLVDDGSGHYTFAVEVRVRVFGPDNKLIFTQLKSLKDTLDKQRLNQIKEKVFGYEGTLPLPPGKYRLDFLLTDWQKKVGMHAEREVTVPAVPKDSFIIPGILAFTSAETVSSQSDFIPFSMAGVRFQPMPSSPALVSPGRDIQVVYQIWSSPRDPSTVAGQKLQIHYALGQPANLGTSISLNDEIGLDQLDATGSLVNGKKLPLNPQWIGTYLLTVAVSRQGNSEHGSASINFKAVGGELLQSPWDLVDDTVLKDSDQGVLDQQRGLCYWSQGEFEQARGFFRRSLARDHANDVARSRLVEAYFAQKDYSSIVSLYNDAGITPETDSETLLRIAESLERSGDAKRAVSLLEDSIRSRPEDGSLYLALADYYERTGNAQKAAELTKKGREYLGSTPSPASETRPN